MATPTTRDPGSRPANPGAPRQPPAMPARPAPPRPAGGPSAVRAKPITAPLPKGAAPPVSISESMQRPVTKKAEAAKPAAPEPAPAAIAKKTGGVLRALTVRRPRKIVVTSEHGLIAAGFAIAFASGAFGIYMNLQPGSLTDSTQSQYWSVFAQLARNHWTSPVAVASADPSASVGVPNIDTIVTGTIPSAQPPVPGAGAAEPSSLRPAVEASLAGSAKPTSLDGYFVRDVFDGMALIESRYGLTLVKPGGVLLGAGHVNSIEQQGGKWVVVTTKGTIPYARK